MAIPSHAGDTTSYFARLFAVLRMAAGQLVSAPSQCARGEAARRVVRQLLVVAAITAIAIAVLMVWFDVPEIELMPPRGTAGLWPARILTDFGKDTYVLLVLVALLLAIAFVAPAVQGALRTWLMGLGMRLQFVFLAISVPLAVGELLKYVIGRGRPFVGGSADAFNFVHFAGKEPYFSLPSAHSITAFALAFAIAAVWPRLRGLMIAYALVIAFTRLVLLAHHPSDVTAGAILGILGAMCVRYWFAVRGLGFAVAPDGTISPLALGRPKGVAEAAPAP